MHEQQVSAYQADIAWALETLAQINADSGGNPSQSPSGDQIAFEHACGAVGGDVVVAQGQWKVPATSSGSTTPQSDLTSLETDAIAFSGDCQQYEAGHFNLASLDHAASVLQTGFMTWTGSLGVFTPPVQP